MLTMKLDGGSGATLWTDILGGSAGGDDLAWDVVVGPDGHPVVSGHVIETGGVTRCLTRKLAAAGGAQIWSAATAGALNDIVSRSAWLGVATDGDILMVQRGYSPANGYDILVARYDAADGHAVWNVRHDGPTHGGDDPRAMTVTAAGDVVVAGVQDTWWNYNYMTLKFSGANGAVLWQAPAYDGPPGWYDVATAVAEGPGGLIVTTGLSDGSGTSWDIATVGYDGATGQQQWVLRQDGPSSQSDEPRAVTVGGGRVFVTGYAYAATTGKDWITLAYDLGLLSPVPASNAGGRGRAGGALAQSVQPAHDRRLRSGRGRARRAWPSTRWTAPWCARFSTVRLRPAARRSPGTAATLRGCRWPRAPTRCA